jgi:hypothetical protein
MSSYGILDLPREIITLILLKLFPHDQVNASKVCKEFAFALKCPHCRHVVCSNIKIDGVWLQNFDDKERLDQGMGQLNRTNCLQPMYTDNRGKIRYYG